MGFLTWFSRKPKGPVRTYDFTDEDRIHAAELRAMDYEAKKLDRELLLNQKRLSNYKILEQISEFEDDEEQLGVDGLFGEFLQNAMTKLQASQSSPSPLTPATSSELRHLSDDELRLLKAKIPHTVLKVLKAKSDDELLALARIHYPDIINGVDEDTIRRALVIIRQ